MTTKEIADAYRAATVEGAWYGPSLAETLAKVTPELAANEAPGGTHSISALLQHLLLWNERIRNASDSNPLPKLEPEKDWAEPSIPWNLLLSSWNASRELLEQRMRGFPAEELQNTVAGRSYTYEFMFRGIVEHTIYHCGQIAMLVNQLKRSS